MISRVKVHEPESKFVTKNITWQKKMTFHSVRNSRFLICNVVSGYLEH